MKNLLIQQEIQENQYYLPYHYRDLFNNNLYLTSYLNRYNHVLKLMKKYGGKTVLDIGCGDGRLCYELKKYNYEIVGIDYSQRAINFARAFNPELKFFTGGLTEIDINQKFDFILIIEVLEHIPANEIPEFLRNVILKLNESGKVIISVPSKNLPLLPKHFQHFDFASLKETLTGFQIIEYYGLRKKGWRKRIYFFLVKVLSLFFKKNIKARRIGDWFYNKYISKGKPEETLEIIAVCQKK